MDVLPPEAFVTGVACGTLGHVVGHGGVIQDAALAEVRGQYHRPALEPRHDGGIVDAEVAGRGAHAEAGIGGDIVEHVACAGAEEDAVHVVGLRIEHGAVAAKEEPSTPVGDPVAVVVLGIQGRARGRRVDAATADGSVGVAVRPVARVGWPHEPGFAVVARPHAVALEALGRRQQAHRLGRAGLAAQVDHVDVVPVAFPHDVEKTRDAVAAIGGVGLQRGSITAARQDDGAQPAPAESGERRVQELLQGVNAGIGVGAAGQCRPGRRAAAAAISSGPFVAHIGDGTIRLRVEVAGGGHGGGSGVVRAEVVHRRCQRGRVGRRDDGRIPHLEGIVERRAGGHAAGIARCHQVGVDHGGPATGFHGEVVGCEVAVAAEHPERIRAGRRCCAAFATGAGVLVERVPRVVPELRVGRIGVHHPFDGSGSAVAVRPVGRAAVAHRSGEVHHEGDVARAVDGRGIGFPGHGVDAHHLGEERVVVATHLHAAGRPRLVRAQRARERHIEPLGAGVVGVHTDLHRILAGWQRQVRVGVFHLLVHIHVDVRLRQRDGVGAGGCLVVGCRGGPVIQHPCTGQCRGIATVLRVRTCNGEDAHVHRQGDERQQQRDRQREDRYQCSASAEQASSWIQHDGRLGLSSLWSVGTKISFLGWTRRQCAPVRCCRNRRRTPAGRHRWAATLPAAPGGTRR